MKKALNSNILLIIFFFSFFRFIDADLIYKGVLFILVSIILIYTTQKNFNKKNIVFIILFLITFIFLNEKKDIIEISSPLKINLANEEQYQKILGSERYDFIKTYYMQHLPNCYIDILNCFENNIVEENYISPDQLIFNSDDNFSRKVAQINFTSLANSRMSFINSFSGNINRHNIYKLDTPFYIEYRDLESISSICYKGLVFIEPINQESYGEYQKDTKCLKKPIKSMTGFNLPEKNLQIYSSHKNFEHYIDDFILLLFFVFIVFNIDKKIFFNKQIKLFLPVLLSTFIIFYISRFDNWFNVFDLYNFYFFGFEGGDGNTYINFTNILFNSILSFNFLDFIRGGEDTFYFTPGLRYFLLINQIISGDFYYLYFFVLFFIPKVINRFLKNQFGERLGYILTISFLLLPIFHHLGFSYYQFLRYSYRLFPEPLGYMFFIAALTIFFSNFEKNYLKMNLLFALSIFLRPNLIISVILIVLISTYKKKINIFNPKYFFILILISIIYFFPLLHNVYFGDTYILFTEYGSNVLSAENISSKNLQFYLDKLISINFIFLLLVFIPSLNIYLKIILVSQYFTIFWFDDNSRYYWIYWLVSINLVIDTIKILYLKKWKFPKSFILK
jgi:hypothetical protein